MRLELNTLMIRDIQFANKTMVSDGVLHINRGEPQGLILEDPRFRLVDIELARPEGKKLRRSMVKRALTALQADVEEHTVLR